MRHLVGRFVCVFFMDHTIEKGEGKNKPDREPLECMAIGELLEISKSKITLRHWHVAGYENNDEVSIILRPVITKWIELKPRRAKRNY